MPTRSVVKKAKPKNDFRESSQDGIPGWDKKRAAFEIIFNAYGDKELVAKVVGDKGDGYVSSVVGSLKSYYDHKPKGHREFFNRLGDGVSAWLKSHKQDQIINGRAIVECSYEDFYVLIPPHLRTGFPPPARLAVGQTTATPAVDLEAVDHPIWVSRVASIEAAKDGVKRGRIDQRVYYLNPDSAEYWKDLISSEQYHQYTECKEALELLVTKQVWLDFFRNAMGDGVVMLGGGSPTKDLVLIKSLLALTPQKSIAHYALIDISPYMLMSAFRLLDSVLRQVQARSKIS